MIWVGTTWAQALVSGKKKYPDTNLGKKKITRIQKQMPVDVDWGPVLPRNGTLRYITVDYCIVFLYV